MAAEHPLALKAAQSNPDIQAFIDQCKQTNTSESELETMEKKGIALNMSAIHPISGEAVPIWAANFVLMGYGTGAVMAVPAHDQRDFEFATKYALPIISTYLPTEDADPKVTEAYVPAKTEKVFYNGGFAGAAWQTGNDAIAAAIDFCEAKGWGRAAQN